MLLKLQSKSESPCSLCCFYSNTGKVEAPWVDLFRGAAVAGQVPVVLVYEKCRAPADLANCWKRLGF